MTEDKPWGTDYIALDESADNPFAPVTIPRKGELFDYLMLGGSILNFPRKKSGNVIDMIDRVLGIPSAIK